MASNKSSKSITVLDVAKHAGVSKSTVSLVLNESDKVSDKSRAKVLRAIETLGYVYNRDAASLRGKSSKLVALVINDLTNPYAAQLAVGLEQHISQLGLDTMLVNTNEDFARQRQVVNSLKEYQVAAFIICPAPGTDASWTDNIIRQGFPVINIMREIPFSLAPAVLPDNRKGSELATAHLLNQGLRHVAFVGGHANISDYHQRLAGYLDALARYQITPDDSLIVQSETNRQGGRNALLELINQNDKKIEGIVCFSDVIAYGVMDQMRHLDLSVGKDIAVVGFDDLEDSRLMAPALSSVHICAQQLGEKACEVLGEILAGKTPQARTLIKVNLMERKSSQPNQ